MILGALANYYDRLAKDREHTRIPPIGYSYENISYVLILRPDGSPVKLEPWLDLSGKKPRPKKEIVPQTERTSGVKAKFLWDNSSYIFGRSSKSKRCNDEHSAFKELHERLLNDPEDSGLRTLLQFLRCWQPSCLESLPGADTILSEDNANIVFRLDGEFGFLHQREAAKEIWLREFGKDNTSPGICLISGDETLIANLHPVIKGVRDAQTRGACIVSFNANAFTSFGKESGANAPVSAKKVYAYTLALNHLLAGDRQRVQIADATTVFWAESPSSDTAAEAEGIFGAFASEGSRDAGENANLMAVLRQIAEGWPLAAINPRLMSEDTKFFVLGLSPNAARIAIRFWQANTFAYFAENLRRHYLDLRIEPAPWDTLPSVWRLLLQTAPRRKSENIPPTLAGAVMRAILTGQPYPQTLFGQILLRIRADRDVNGRRAAILKACLARIYKEVIPVSLDVNEMNRGYRLGRLFAVLEAAQYAGIGKTNASITDKFISAASATPNRVFPLLLRGSQHHLSSAKKKGRVGRAIRLEKAKAQIIEGLDGQQPFPLTLQLADQGKFFVGFYHQQQELFVPHEAGEKIEDLAPAGEENGEE